MPIKQSAKKAIRNSARRKSSNDRQKKLMKDIIKKIEKLSKADKSSAQKELSSAYALIDKSAKKGIIKKNNASRKKSRLARLSA